VPVLGEEARGVVGVLDEPVVGFVSHFIFSVTCFFAEYC
jgi:hypothetical protein